MSKNLFVLFVLLATSIYSQTLLNTTMEVALQTINTPSNVSVKYKISPVSTELCWVSSGNCDLQYSSHSTNWEISIDGTSYTNTQEGLVIADCDEDNFYRETDRGTYASMRLAKYKIQIFTLEEIGWTLRGYVYYDNRDGGFVHACDELSATDCGSNDIALRYNYSNKTLYLFEEPNYTSSMSGAIPIMTFSNPSGWGYQINWWEVKDCSYHLALDFAGDPDVPTGFSVTGDVDEHPQLSWNPNDDTDLDGYKIYYKLGSSIYYYLITLDKTYNSFTDNGVIISDGRFDPFACYKISAVDLGDNESDKTPQDCVQYDAISKEGNSELDSIDQKDYKLYQAFPNPFNPTTKIKFYVPHNTHVKIELFNSIGEVITEMINSDFEKGLYSFTFDGSKLSSGIYYYRLITDHYTATRKIQLVK